MYVLDHAELGQQYLVEENQHEHVRRSAGSLANLTAREKDAEEGESHIHARLLKTSFRDRSQNEYHPSIVGCNL